MNPPHTTVWIAFTGHERIALGEPREVAALVKQFVDDHPDRPVAILDADSSRPVEIDLRGTVEAVLGRLPPAPVEAPSSTGASAVPSAGASEVPSAGASEVPSTGEPAQAARGPGRPRLGVVAREVTLLPRHWDWLASQPGGASVALRKLVERALRTSAQADRVREATDSAYRFMHALAGNESGFEEASRALFAGDLERLETEVARWPHDVRLHLLELAGRALGAGPANAAPTAG